MASLEDILKSDVTKGVAVGIGALLLGPRALPVLSQAARPLARAAIKSGILLYEKGREVAAEASEIFEDLVAEVRAELAQEVSAVDPSGLESAVESTEPGGTGSEEIH